MTRVVKAPGFKVLVRLKNIEKNKEEVSAGGIIMQLKSENDLELEQQGMCEGYVMDIGPLAGYINGIPEKHVPCRVGDAVLFHRYAGTLLEGMQDEFNYRMISDLDIQAVFPEEGIKI